MQQLLEPDPKLLTPEYWQGIDPMTMALVEPPAAAKSLRLTRRERRQAWRALEECVQLTIDGRCRLLAKFACGEFDGSAIGGPMGIVMTDEEFVFPLDPALHDRVSALASELWDQPPQPPLPDELLEPWQTACSASQLPAAGEIAFFTEPAAIYLRMLGWGLIVPRPEPQPHIIASLPTLATWQTLKEKKLSPPPKLTALPLRVGEVNPSVSSFEGIALKGLNRIRSIELIGPSQPSRSTDPTPPKNPPRVPVFNSRYSGRTVLNPRKP